MKITQLLPLILLFLAGCSSIHLADKCDLFAPTPLWDKPTRINAVYSASYMHGAVLTVADCSGRGRRTFGESETTGPAAVDFQREIRSGFSAYRNEYEIEATVKLVPDEDGPMLELLKIWSFKKK